MAAFRDHTRWSDAELLDGIAGRDGQAFSAFYRRHLRLVLSTLVRDTGDREIAADLTAEVFAAVMVSAKRYEPRHDSASGWLLAIARNVLGHSRRRGQADDRARRRLGMEAVAFHDGDLDRIDVLLDDAAGPALALVGDLPALERSALLARIVDERSYADIAAASHCTEMVVRKRVSRGLAKLRARMAG